MSASPRRTATRPAPKPAKRKRQGGGGDLGGGDPQYGDWQPAGVFRRRASVKLDGSGNGMVTFDVQHANQMWQVHTVQASTGQTSVTAPNPQMVVYLGGQQEGSREGASWVGNQVTLHGSIDMNACDTLTVSFTGGPAAAVATVVIAGDNFLWR